MQVGDSGISFMWAIAALADETTSIKVSMPATMLMAAGGKAAAGSDRPVMELLRETALKARDDEPVPSPQTG